LAPSTRTSTCGFRLIWSEWAPAPPLGSGFGPEQFALIPAGSFQMGDMVGSGDLDELPVHTVNITKVFYMQKTEVTQGQWRAVMGTNPSYFSDCGDTCPVEQVSWDDIQGFLTALNAMDPGKNYRLPTEAEWEYAARAGTTGDYGGTGVLDEMGWYSANSGSQTHPVAQKTANAWGLSDMHGNVWEWVNDSYSTTYYQYCVDKGIVDDPPGPATGSNRVLRGGSWLHVALSARSAHRGYVYPNYRYVGFGFRLARTQ
jgi:formylglycine-generating enzyme required for sulfatase activity